MPIQQDIFKAAEQGAGGLGVDHLLDAVDRINGHLDLEVALQPGNRSMVVIVAIS